MTEAERAFEVLAATPMRVRRAAEALAYMDGAADYRLQDVARNRGVDAVNERLQRGWRELGALKAFGLTVTLENAQN